MMDMHKRRAPLVSFPPAVAALALALTLVLVACGGGGGSDGGQSTAESTGESTDLGTVVTKQEWESVSLDDSRNEILDRFGQPAVEPSNYESAGFETLSYNGPSANPLKATKTASFTFNDERMYSKGWSVAYGRGAEIEGKGISAAQLRSLEAGTTRAQVEARFGPPNEREEWIFRGRAPEYHIAYWYRPKPGEPALIYFNPGGTLDHTYVGGVVKQY
jgi:outer membrane protein assembly factor BamE (lipoprotein component of BamABCDE complex)